MAGGGRRRASQSIYRDGHFVADESCLAYLQATMPNHAGTLSDSNDGHYGRGTLLRVIDSRGRSKVILFSSSSSDGESASDSKLLYQGDRAYYVKEILDERIFESTKEYLILWDGYDTPTWVPAINVNDVAKQMYKKKAMSK